MTTTDETRTIKCVTCLFAPMATAECDVTGSLGQTIPQTRIIPLGVCRTGPWPYRWQGVYGYAKIAWGSERYTTTHVALEATKIGLEQQFGYLRDKEEADRRSQAMANEIDKRC